MSKSWLSQLALLLAAFIAYPAEAQIGWQNVSSGSAPNVSGQMGAAQQSFNNAFGQLNNVLAERESIDRANWENRKRNNTQEFLNFVYNYRTVDELRAHRDEIEQKRQSYGYQIDQDVARNAYDNRFAALAQQEQWASKR